MIHNTNKKGFTLIELMIVVAIIWVLAVTIIPALTGAQARARDAGRIAGLQNVSAVLETYYSDNGKFPMATAAGAGTEKDDTWVLGCLSNSSWATSTDLADMFKGQKTPLNPQVTATSGNCAEAWAYAYFPLQKSSVDMAWFLLVADIENYVKANSTLIDATYTATTWLWDWTGLVAETYEEFVTAETAVAHGKPGAEVDSAVDCWGTAWAKCTVYTVSN